MRLLAPSGTRRRMDHRRSIAVTVVAVIAVLGLAGTSSGKTDPAVGCGAFELKTAGATASAVLGCHAVAAEKGLAVDPGCVGGAANKLAAAFAKAEAIATKAGGACPAGPDATATQDEIDAFVGDVVQALRPSQGPSKCVAKKLAKVGKYAQVLLGAHAANRIKSDSTKFADKATKAAASLAVAFQKLEDKGKDCATAKDASAMAANVHDLIVAEVCDDADRCTTDDISGLVCQHAPITCADHYACDFRTGSCAYTDCCLMRLGTGLCVVEIPGAEIPTSQAYCQGVDAAHANLSLINFGPQCIGWRAAGAGNCS